jgi:hypothetical protein
MESEAVLKGGRRVFFFRMCSHQRGIGVQHNHPAKICAGDLRGGHRRQHAPQQANLGPSLIHSLQRRLGDLI